MSLDRVLAQTMEDVTDCVAAGLVDLVTGTLLGVKTADPHPPEVLNMAAAATSDLFQGPNVVLIENMFKKLRAQTDDHEHYFQELIVLSKNLIHVFIRGRMFHAQALVIVARAGTNLGSVLNQARRRIDAVETATIAVRPYLK